MEAWDGMRRCALDLKEIIKPPKKRSFIFYSVTLHKCTVCGSQSIHVLVLFYLFAHIVE